MSGRNPPVGDVSITKTTTWKVLQLKPPPAVILAIDDDMQILELLRDLLRPLGYHVIRARGADQGIDLARVHKPSAILLDLVMPRTDGFETARRLSSDVSLKHIPVIAMTGHDTAKARLRDIVNQIDDYILKPFDPVDLETRLALALHRSRTVGGSNPLTRLPGNVAIQEEIMDRIQDGREFALLHIDLDEFKAFNDHYGFMRGDEVIKLLARCARDAVAAHAPTGGFLGHVGGDDMAAVVDPETAVPVAEYILDRWDDLIPNLYEPEDVAKGYIEVVDRRGEVQRYPMASVSIGIATTATRPLHTHWEASEVAAEMKHVAKSRSGSSIAIDRRRQITLDSDAAVPVS